MPLTKQLAAEIADRGSIRFDRFMARALFDPDHGYYASGRAQIGREGDFYTNVSVGQVFGRVLAAQCAEVWERLGEPAVFDIVEQGGNDGRLAADLLDSLRDDHSRCLAATRFTFVEPFAKLAEAQRETLSAHLEKVRWIDSLNAMESFTGVHLTNEYADALPVRLFIRQENTWLERHVVLDEGRLRFDDRAASELPTILPDDAPDGYQAEYRPEGAEWVTQVASKLTRGLMLAIDYGFPRHQLYAPWRTTGTFSCYRAHRRDDCPLEAPGDKDLTAHVDFTALAEAGMEAGLDLAGFTDQYHFLVGAGTPLLLAMEAAGPSPRRDADLRAFKSLLHPETMGTQFKYLALSRGLDLSTVLAGFRHGSSPAATLNTNPSGT